MSSIAAALRDVLLAPDFLFRLEFDPPGAAPGTRAKVSDWELASRLSFFLWSSIPDDELLDVARSGKLRDPVGVGRARCGACLPIRAPPRWPTTLRRSGWDFAVWAKSSRTRRSIRNSTAALAADFEQETRLFVRSVIRENRSVLDLIGADYTYLNERLARHLRNPGCDRTGLSPRFAGWQPGARRSAWPGQHPAADLPHHEDLAHSAGQMDSRQSAEFASAAAAAGRAAAR